MADHIELTADHDGTLENRDVRAALADADVSKTSPLTPNRHAAATAVGDETVTVKASGDGDFTRTSERGLKSALASIDAVDSESVEVTAGGYDDSEESEDDDSDE